MHSVKFRNERKELEMALFELVEYMIRFAEKKLGSRKIPTYKFSYTYRRRNESGSSNRTDEYEIQDYATFSFENKKGILPSQGYQNLRRLTGEFVDTHGVELDSFPRAEYAEMMVRHYFEGERYFSVNSARIADCVNEFINDITSDYIAYKLIYNIEQFDACQEFTLAKDIKFEKIDDLSLAVYSSDNLRTGTYPEPLLYSDSWLITVFHKCKKTDVDSINEVKPKFEKKLLVSLNLLQSGGPRFRLVFKSMDSNYLSRGMGSSRNIILCGNNDSMFLDKSALDQFRSYFSILSSAKVLDHYFSLFERIKDSLNRGSYQDRFVDLVIVLEMLLASDTEHLESTYRFKFRGAYLTKGIGLGSAKKRLQLLSRIYSLRSDIVHGPSNPKKVKEIDKLQKEIREYEPKLRLIVITVLRWYLKHLDKYPNNMLPLLDEIMVSAPIEKD